MEIRLLKYFLAVAREGTISRAAERLHITQPTLSKQLQQLERECGAQLIVRGKRHISLTEEGVLLRDRAERLVQMADQLEADIRDATSEVSGEVRIGAGEGERMVVVARAMREVLEVSPSVRFHVVSDAKVDLMPQLESGMIDFAVVPGTVDVSRFECLRLPGVERCGFLVRQDDPLAERRAIALDDLAGRKIMLPDRPLVGSEQTGWLSRDASDYDVVVVNNLFNNAAIMVREGVGILFTYESLARLSAGDGLVFIPLEPAMEEVFHCVWRRHEPLSHAARRFLEMLRTEVSAAESPSED